MFNAADEDEDVEEDELVVVMAVVEVIGATLDGEAEDVAAELLILDEDVVIGVLMLDVV